ncbi:MAG: hypothetical protein P4L40_03815 [Terracidiphilus sp.]|nr:hypothetical protein [Terracidiphilus sp.]
MVGHWEPATVVQEGDSDGKAADADTGPAPGVLDSLIAVNMLTSFLADAAAAAEASAAVGEEPVPQVRCARQEAAPNSKLPVGATRGQMIGLHPSLAATKELASDAPPAPVHATMAAPPPIAAVPPPPAPALRAVAPTTTSSPTTGTGAVIAAEPEGNAGDGVVTLGPALAGKKKAKRGATIPQPAVDILKEWLYKVEQHHVATLASSRLKAYPVLLVMSLFVSS